MPVSVLKVVWSSDKHTPRSISLTQLTDLSNGFLRSLLNTPPSAPLMRFLSLSQFLPFSLSSSNRSENSITTHGGLLNDRARSFLNEHVESIFVEHIGNEVSQPLVAARWATWFQGNETWILRHCKRAWCHIKLKMKRLIEVNMLFSHLDPSCFVQMDKHKNSKKPSWWLLTSTD